MKKLWLGVAVILTGLGPEVEYFYSQSGMEVIFLPK